MRSPARVSSNPIPSHPIPPSSLSSPPPSSPSPPLHLSFLHLSPTLQPRIAYIHPQRLQDMGNCASTTQEAEGKARSDMIDRQIEEDSKRYKRECKILLLGTCATPILCPSKRKRAWGKREIFVWGNVPPHAMTDVNGACGSHSNSHITGLHILIRVHRAYYSRPTPNTPFFVLTCCPSLPT